MGPRPAGAAGIDLYWLPLGAGAHSVRWNGRVYEHLVAARDRREPCDLYHAALEVRLGADRFVVEMAPVWDPSGPDRGVVVEGAVGFPWLGRSRWFRYEVRRWRGGLISDVSEAVGGAHRVSGDADRAIALLDLVPHFPTATWGRDELHTGDMWNSNSLIAWLLTRTGHDGAQLRPPPGGRAPGWAAGRVVAARHGPGVAAVRQERRHAARGRDRVR